MAKLVLLKLADHADENGECFPSIERIATDTEMNERSVRRHLEALEAAGLIDRRTRGRGKFYRLNVAAKPDTEAGNEQLTPDTESANTAPTPDSLSTTPDSLSKTPDTESGRSLTVSNHQEPVKKEGRTKRAPRTARIAADWMPSTEGLQLARNEGLTDDQINKALDRFVDHYVGTGRRAADWEAFWRNWIREDVRRADEGAGGGWDALTEQDHAQVKAEREGERVRAIESAPWRQASLRQLISNAYDLPRAVVADSWQDLCDLLPPDLSEGQINDIAEFIEDVEDDMRAAGSEATAVILRKLAAVVALPERDDMAMTMATYLEDLQDYPEHILIDVTTAWRRNEKFWPTIAELRKMCHWHEYNIGRMQKELRSLYLLRAVGESPAPGLLVTSGWMRDCEADARMMAMRFDRFTPRKRIETDKAPKLAIAS